MMFLVHRWLGIGLSLLMALWTLSGIVMMYVSFPETTREERLAGLEPLALSRCCADALPAAGTDIKKATVEMLAGKPVLRWTGSDGSIVASLAGVAPEIDENAVRQVATGYMQRVFGSNPAMKLAIIDHDQWTVYGRFREHEPLWKASFADRRGTVLYVSGKTGEVVQDTNLHERFWNWLGAVPHWLYFSALRRNTRLWSNVVIYASLLGTFLTLTGIYIGLRMYGRGKRKSPFRGLALWHHWAGLIFGLVTLTWVFSGFASMNPWGWLESNGPETETAALAGRPLARSDVAALVNGLAAHPQAGIVSAEVVVQHSEPYALLSRANAMRFRATLPDLRPAPPAQADLAALAGNARPGAAILSQGLIAQGDTYHYSHHSSPAVLPAWRVIYADRDHTRLYFDPRTGELVDYVDGPTRAFRWWHLGLHRLDLPGLSVRPLWDAIMLPLLGGVLLLCILGAWMGARRLSGKRLRVRARDILG
jgi:hypothetical protein